MRYLIKEKIFTIGDKFSIEDENGRPAYEVEGRILSLGKKLHIYDLDGREVVYIEQQLFKLLSEYFIYQNNKKVGKVKREFTFLSPKFNIESLYGDFTVEGDIFQHEFVIKKDRKEVARISKKWIAWSDTYGIEIRDNVDHAFILAIVIVLDQIYHDNVSTTTNTSNS